MQEWLKNQDLQSNNITKEEIKEKAVSIYDGDKFVASDRWVSAFMKRYHRKENNSYTFHDDLDKSIGKSLPEALIRASTNPQYDKKLFIDLLVQYMKTTSSEHVVYINCSEYQNKIKKQFNL